MTTPSKEDLEENLRGWKCTDGWDVLVAYRGGPLNNLLGETWAKKMSANTIPIKLTYDISLDDDDEEIAINKHYDVQLSAPSLEFTTGSTAGSGTLVFDIDATYYTVHGDAKPKTTHSIPHDVYRLQVDVPISSISGDGTEHETGDKVVEFKDETVSEHYLVLHFENKQTTWQIKKKDPSKDLPTDNDMRKLGQEIVLWLQDSSRINWIDFRMAGVTNKKDTSETAINTNYLRPKSFTFSTAPGVLNVFIRTKGDEGHKPPRFNYKGDEAILPIPARSEACIIISQRLFGDFVASQIQEHCKDALRASDAVKVSDTASSGIEWKLYLKDSKTWNIGNHIGLQKYSIDKVEVNFDELPLTFGVVDDDKLVPKSTWKFDFSAKAKWSLHDDAAGVSECKCGETKITASLAKQGKEFGHLSGDTITLELDYDTSESPKINLEGLTVADESPFVGTTNVPEPFKQITITLPSFETKLDGLSFFAAQNVLVPGIEFIKPTEVMVPHDVVIPGTMPRAKSAPPTCAVNPSPKAALKRKSKTAVNFSPKAARKRRSKAARKRKSKAARKRKSKAAMPGSSVHPNARGSFTDLLDHLYGDDYFLGDFINRCNTGKPRDVSALLAEKGYTFDTGNTLSSIQNLITPGPDFDLRFAGGVYETHGGDATYQLLVHPVHRTIFVGGRPVQNQIKHEDGRITFKTYDGEINFDVIFHCEYNGDNKNNLHSLEGKIWSKSQAETDATLVGGQRVFPWHDENASMDTITRVDTEGFKSLAVSLDLLNFADDGEPANHPPSVTHSLRLRAEAITAIAGVLGIIVAFWAVDKGIGEGWQRWKKRVKTLKQLVTSMNEKGFIKALKSSTSKAKLKEAAKNMEEVMDRIINHNLDKATELDINIDTVLEETKSDVDEQVAEFIHSGFEIAARKGFKGMFSMDQEGASEALKKTIKDGLGQWMNEDAYKEYLKVKIQRIMFERDRTALLTGSSGIDRRIRAAETQIEQTRQKKEKLEAAKVEEVEKIMKEKSIPEVDAKEEVEKKIQDLADAMKEQEEKVAEGEAKKARGDKRVDELQDEIEKRKKQEEAQKGEIWKKEE